MLIVVAMGLAVVLTVSLTGCPERDEPLAGYEEPVEQIGDQLQEDIEAASERIEEATDEAVDAIEEKADEVKEGREQERDDETDPEQ